MRKVKDWLIHKLGGYTFNDMLVRSRPVQCRVTQSEIRTLKIKRILRAETMATPAYQLEHARKDMANRIADKMLEDGLISFSSNAERPYELEYTAIARIVTPTEVSE